MYSLNPQVKSFNKCCGTWQRLGTTGIVGLLWVWGWLGEHECDVMYRRSTCKVWNIYNSLKTAVCIRDYLSVYLLRCISVYPMPHISVPYIAYQCNCVKIMLGCVYQCTTYIISVLYTPYQYIKWPYQHSVHSKTVWGTLIGQCSLHWFMVWWLPTVQGHSATKNFPA